VSRPYVGLRVQDHGFEYFRAARTPTGVSHGHLYGAVIGPFRTAQGARFMADYGRGNPHCQTVAEAERLARSQRGSQP
jgi:hypothetical protein